jgi:hypothetical protein
LDGKGYWREGLLWTLNAGYFQALAGLHRCRA